MKRRLKVRTGWDLEEGRGLSGRIDERRDNILSSGLHQIILNEIKGLIFLIPMQIEEKSSKMNELKCIFFCFTFQRKRFIDILSWESNPSNQQKLMIKERFQGVLPLRKCKEDEVSDLLAAYELCKPIFTKATDETVWFNIFLNGKLTVEESDLIKRFNEWVISVVQETETEKMNIHSYGFFFSPRKSSKDQEYHIDYKPEIKQLFVTMVNHTSKNSTQFVKFEPVSKPTKGAHEYNRYGADDIQLLEREGLDFMEVVQVVCKPYTILKMGENTVHRGIMNREEEDRPMFFVTYSNTDYIFNEAAYEKHDQEFNPE